MSILLVDIGNTRIKWARLDGSRLGRQRAAVHSDWDVRDFERKLLGAGPHPERILVASVAGPATDRHLVGAARKAGTVAPEFVKSVRSAAGVTTRYAEPWRLGVDRFVAAIGAFHLARGRPACVISIGTAVTIDLVDERGQHKGGAITPGLDMMVESLLDRTNGIRHRARGRPVGKGLFARSTRAAIEQGVRYAVASLVERAVAEARRAVGSPPMVIVTGGGAGAVRPLIRCTHVTVPDLVLRGLAVIAGAGALPGRRARRRS